MILNTYWTSFLSEECNKDYFLKLQIFIEEEYKTKTIFPPYNTIFRAFNLLTPEKVKVVIIGQDPYHGMNQADGLAFSISKNSKLPPSLKNIYKELVDDIICEYPSSGDLTPWAKEGILLINSVLTVKEAQAHSHKNQGWEKFTDSVIEKLSQEFEHLVFILWGAGAQKKSKLVDKTKHLVLQSSHPSPLSSYRGFFGSKPFSKTNQYLQQNNKKSINWILS